MFQGTATLYLTTLLTALGFMLIGYDNVSTDVGENMGEADS